MEEKKSTFKVLFYLKKNAPKKRWDSTHHDPYHY